MRSEIVQFKFLLLTITMVISLISISLPVHTQENTTGNVSLNVYIIEDLKLNPVPFLSFNIIRQGEDNNKTVARTDELGKLVVELPIGIYMIENIKPVVYKGKNYQWSRKVTVEHGKVCVLTLTDEDSNITAGKNINTEGELYKRFISGIVTVESEIGHGTGFVVDQQGLIMTNSHVVENSNQFVIKFGPGKRYPAILVENDTSADVAILRYAKEMNPKAPIIPLVSITEESYVTVGERVCAMGSPLDQEQILTSGIISKVTKDTIISDVNINGGNSGGPLFNMNGEVIGLNTFIHTPTKAGPGFAGIVPIAKALPVLEKARAKYDRITQPEARQLPDVSPVKVPVASMEIAAKSDISYIKVRESLDDFEVYINTPMIEISQIFIEERKMEKQHKSKVKDKSNELNLEKFKDWQKKDAVVSLIVQPLLKETSGSQWGTFFSILVTGEDIGQDKYTYRDDFKEMNLYRGNELIEPMRRIRSKTVINVENANAKAVDYAYAGICNYDPMVFEPSKQLVLKVNTGKLDKKHAEWATIKIDPKVQKNIWESFALWRVEVEKNNNLQTEN